MAYPTYVREKARALRADRCLSIVEIAERLALPKSTIYYWVRDLPLGRPRRASAGQRRGNRKMREHYRRLRSEAYEFGRLEYPALVPEPTFTDFVCLYIAEGSKRRRNEVTIGNSDPAVIAVATLWIRRFSRNPVNFALQYHADQNLPDLTRFWARVVDIAPSEIRLQRKSNSNQLRGRTWRSRYGVLTVRACDTLFRARLQAWIDCRKRAWLDSADDGAWRSLVAHPAWDREVSGSNPDAPTTIRPWDARSATGLPP
jgi:predicted DNA-binding transcriptional regulator AlpA